MFFNKETSKPSEDYHVELISSDSDVEQKKNSELLSFFSSSEEKQSFFSKTSLIFI